MPGLVPPRPRPSLPSTLALLSGLALAACAGKTPAATAPAAAPAPPDTSQFTPPPLTIAAPAAATSQASANALPADVALASRAEPRRAVFDAVYGLVRDKHYDKTLGGLDWPAVRQRYEGRALGAPNDATFYRLLNEMIGELGQSHLEVMGPGSPGRASFDGDGPAAAGGAAEPGLTVRVIEGKPTITYVRPESPAARAGLHAGFVVTHIGGWATRTSGWSARPLRPIEERFFARVAFSRRLAGPPGSHVTLKYLDGSDRPSEVVLEREMPHSKSVKLGLLPPLFPEVRVSQIGNVGVLAFNLFLSEEVLPRVQSALDGFRQRGAKAVILDLRGNPGGQGAVAIPIAARLVDKPVTLGTLRFRDFDQTFTASPPMDSKPFTGRVVIITDEGSASTAEIFAAGLQESGRALIVGDTTLGAVLPSQIESLPGGAVMQYVVADFRTPKGILLEGRGVQPDRRVLETRSALLGGRDPVLDAALVTARASGSR
jgi:carboxyl-terminal processing protease